MIIVQNDVEQILLWLAQRPVLVGLISAAVGAGIGHLFTETRERRKARTEWKEHQLRTLYAPLFAQLLLIDIYSQLSNEVHAIAARIQRTEEAGIAIPEEQKWKDREYIAYREAATEIYTIQPINYSNKLVQTQIVPGYREMLKILIENANAASASTARHIENFIKFVETWNRSEGTTGEKPPLDIRILVELQTYESNLRPFYDELEFMYRDLSIEINARNRPMTRWLLKRTLRNKNSRLLSALCRLFRAELPICRRDRSASRPR